MKTRHQTRFIQEESQVPPGYVAMRDFGVDGADYKAVARAQKNGLVRAMKLVRHEGELKNGVVWVHKGDADEYLRSLSSADCEEQLTEEQPAAAKAVIIAAAAQDQVCRSLSSIDATLDEIHRVLKSLTNAVESIATQPKDEAAGTWRDMNGEAL